MNSLLLATDLDGTLVGDDDATQRLFNALDSLRANKDVKLVYVTGRSLELFKQLKSENNLLDPAALITAVGTEIYIDGQHLEEWPRVAGWDVEAIKSTLSNIPQLELQPETEQRSFKVSYFLNENPSVLADIKNKLQDHPVDIVYSQNRYLDILPKCINKGSALNFLASRWKIDHQNIVACGDSGNDINMLERHNAIIVGNAREELLKWYAENHQSTYLAKGHFANGILEGLKHYGFVD